MPSKFIRPGLLDLIGSFVAVGRRMSITLAAQDLCLTQSAVSRQIRSLEDMLEVKLLHRGHRAISFTTEGARLFRTANEAIEQLQQVCGALTNSSERSPVIITASIGVMALWLLPRLGDFQGRHPDIDVHLAANNRMLDLPREGIDLAIRYCTERSVPVGATRLFGEAVAPIAHPSLALASLDSAQTVADLFLLEYVDPQHPWLQWAEYLSFMGIAGAKPKGFLRFNQYDHVIQAALAGQGVALGRIALVETLLEDKRLARLDAATYNPSCEYAYWLVLGAATPREDVLQVAAWIRSEAAKVRLERPRYGDH
jgi:LysR family transcriptional regulator, glycine cleavage system transcriptional activator